MTSEVPGRRDMLSSPIQNLAGSRPSPRDSAALPEAPPLLSARGISKSFAGVQVLRDIGFELGRGEVMALLGENGAGKSTLKNILSGLLTPDGGTIRADDTEYAALSAQDVARIGLGTIHQELSLFGNLSVAENIHMPALAHRRGFVDWKGMTRTARTLLTELDTDIAPERLVDTLSLGERQLVEIAKAMHRASSILILDEPTTCLSLPERQRLFGVVRRLKARGYGIIYITHFLEEVFELADQVVIMRDGVVADRGEPGAMTAERITRSMVGGDLAAMRIEPPALPADAPVVLRAERISDTAMLRDVSLTLRRGEILGVAWLMGAGRSEFAEVLLGLRPGGGTVELDGQPFAQRSPRAARERGLVLVSEDRRRDQAFLGRDLIENITAPALDGFAGRGLGWLDQRAERSAAQDVARRYAVQPARLDNTMVRLSGGNQQKAIIGRWLADRPKVCVLDEPTKGIDIGARATVHGLFAELAAEGIGFILISSDIPELLALSHRIVVLHKGRLVGELPRAEFEADRILAIASTGVQQ